MMRSTRKLALSAGIAASLALVLAAPAILRAFNPPEPPGRFGMVGLARAQTARLSVVNIADPSDPATPPDPCRVTLGFVDTSGQPFVDQTRQPITKDVNVLAGQAALLDLRFDAVADGNDWRATPLDRTGRVQFRAGLQFPASLPSNPCGDLVPTLEVFDNLTGRTTMLYAPLESPRPEGSVPSASAGGAAGSRQPRDAFE
jgi:hypothetical protein